jgi:subtilisin family serine protease
MLFALAISLASIFATSASASSKEDRYIVVLKDSIEYPGAVAEDQAAETGGDVSLVYRSALKGYAATLPPDAVAELESDPKVDYVTPDRRVAAQTIPTGVSRIFAAQSSAMAINQIEDGQVNVDVAVIDTGIDYTQPDLNVVARTNCVPTGEQNEAVTCVNNSGTDGYGHGTHVAGTIGALDNGFGVSGVAPGARMWSVRALNNQGWGYESWIVGGVDWVTSHAAEIEVANMSLGCECAQPALEEAISASVEAGVVYTVSAGNSAADAAAFSPAKNKDVITVSALSDSDGKPGALGEECGEEIGADDSLASFSNRGTAVDVIAPGTCILSTVPYGGSELFGGGSYVGTLSGTSMAAPHVAGAAAILASRSNPNSKADVEAIRQTIVEEGNSNWTDTSGDGVKEPLLDVSDEAVFNPPYFRVSTKAVTGVTPTEAVLNGTANPGGMEASYQFEYGTTTSYGSKLPASPKSIGSGIEAVNFSQPVTGLKSNTTYHYRVWVYRENGKSAGEDMTFKTSIPAPTVKTEPPSYIARYSVILNGVVNPNGALTTYDIEYGLTTSYGKHLYSPTWPPGVSPGSGTSDVAIMEQAQGLEPDTTYHYRVTATNAGGTSYGKDMEFVTTPPTSRFYGQVKLTNPYILGSMECTMSGQVGLNEGTFEGASLDELEFSYCSSWSYLLQGCQVATTFEGGNFSEDVETSTVTIDELHLEMTYHGGTCAANGFTGHLNGTLSGEYYVEEGEESEGELTLNSSTLVYEDPILNGSSLLFEGALYFEGPPVL